MGTIGRIASMHRYPVKSMAGEQLAAAPLTLQGLPWDRLIAFVQARSSSTFPWLTARQANAMLMYSARAAGGFPPADDSPPAIEVTTPAGTVLAADGDELLAELEKLAGREINRVADYRGSYDVAQVSLMTNASVRAIAEASDVAPDPLRFRMNFYIDTGSGEPFTENQWVGRVLRIGEAARVAVTETDQRCVMITLDHSTSTGSPRVLRSVAELNNAAAGVYASVLTAGEVREGDEVTVE